MGRKTIAQVSAEIDGLDGRLKRLEADMMSVQESVKNVAADTAQILAIVAGAKSVGGFLTKHGPRAISAISGAAVAAGFLNPKISAFLTALFN